ncbi:hypothetical protein QRO08_03620 [Paracidovorax citrulli]|uniref:Uncharacterized protein n=1 Tax=Paracidovorax citrulli TaxID=80869 RepID=A0ABY9AT10_PARCI|nr:hypothetical protein [Paracidovorax citrulli]ATG96748.1 hypothetical protein CQB05_24285 [Paracidovorax citrulli]MVT28738.1 hypothetical protein [Paracidovorax citrulli]MVT37400.1 hypothetical protein [Paracidovorax citrulli]PVY64116.1 hypothetical protein C8E08_1427 [Paracidovorax citrulli]REG71682.1 hypothetical protein C8E07_4940 [Paracidovorax citrulli]
MSAPTKKQLASRHIRRLRTMREQILDMSCQWEDLDQFCVNELQALADAAEATAVTLLDDDSSKEL